MIHGIGYLDTGWPGKATIIVGQLKKYCTEILVACKSLLTRLKPRRVMITTISGFRQFTAKELRAQTRDYAGPMTETVLLGTITYRFPGQNCTGIAPSFNLQTA